MPFLSQAHGSIHYRVLGLPDSPKVLMLRGLGRSSRYWLGFEEVMAKSFQLLLIDLRGTGDTSVPVHWSDSIEDMAGDVKAVLDFLHWDKIHIFALSLGGMVAASFAAAHPTRVKSLAIGASSSADSSLLRLAPSSIRQLLPVLKKPRFQEVLVSCVLHEGATEEFRAHVLSEWRKILAIEGFPWSTIVKQLVAASRFRLGGLLKDGGVPVLVMVGDADRFVPPYNSRRIHRLIPHSTYREIKGAGHELTLGFEAEVFGVLNSFFLSNEGKPPL